MKLNIVKAISIAGLLCIPQLIQAGPLIEEFAVGQPLTAAQMNAIKAFVEYNSLNISGLEAEPKATVSASAPSVNDDINSGYITGSVWIDTASGEAYILADSTSGAAVWKLITQAPTIYAIGDTGPAGGWVFYVDADGQHGLEAAPGDQSTGIRWDNVSNASTDTEANGDGVGAGEMNTMLIIANQGSDSATYAAGIAANLVITQDGVNFGDWYLPSKFELNLMWGNLADSDGNGTNTGDTDPDNLGNFVDASYWGSSQWNNTIAVMQDFSNGYQGLDYKYQADRVRAVRRF